MCWCYEENKHREMDNSGVYQCVLRDDIEWPKGNIKNRTSEEKAQERILVVLEAVNIEWTCSQIGIRSISLKHRNESMVPGGLKEKKIFGRLLSFKDISLISCQRLLNYNWWSVCYFLLFVRNGKKCKTETVIFK